MRHLLANIAIYAITVLLLLGAVLFAWSRSAQLTVSDESTLVGRYDPRASQEYRWPELGDDSYQRNCANCHREDGGGWDQYPALDHVARILTAPGGREFLIDVHLYGLASERWRAPMPPMGHMSDIELAAVINHVLTRFGAEQPMENGMRLYAPDEVAARRGLDLSPFEVEAGRPDLQIQ